MRKTFLTLFILLLLISNIFGQKRSAKITKGKIQNELVTQLSAPKDWKLVDLGSFSFILPKSMKIQKETGIDSFFRRFESDEIELGIDSGRYIVTIGVEGFKHQKQQIEIDGVKGQYLIVDYSKPNLPTITIEEEERQKPFLQAVIFYRGKDFYSSFWVRFKNIEQKEIAEKILYSIKFKRK